jgi:hypothetical protein
LNPGEYGGEVSLKTREKMITICPMAQRVEEEFYRDFVARELSSNGEIQGILRIVYLKSFSDPLSLRMPVSWFV